MKLMIKILPETSIKQAAVRPVVARQYVMTVVSRTDEVP